MSFLLALGKQLHLICLIDYIGWTLWDTGASEPWVALNLPSLHHVRQRCIENNNIIDLINKKYQHFMIHIAFILIPTHRRDQQALIRQCGWFLLLTYEKFTLLQKIIIQLKVVLQESCLILFGYSNVIITICFDRLVTTYNSHLPFFLRDLHHKSW